VVVDTMEHHIGDVSGNNRLWSLDSGRVLLHTNGILCESQILMTVLCVLPGTLFHKVQYNYGSSGSSLNVQRMVPISNISSTVSPCGWLKCDPSYLQYEYAMNILRELGTTGLYYLFTILWHQSGVDLVQIGFHLVDCCSDAIIIDSWAL
jgi:hypothetical protein